MQTNHHPFGSPAVRAVFLDRDGVLNRKMPEGEYVRCWSDFHALDGVAESIARLNRAGILALVVSNQRGIALGLYSEQDVRGIHARFQQDLARAGAHVDGFYFCPHDKGACACRKPLPGLYEQAKRDFPQLDAAASVMVGDSLSDIEFGARLGMRTIFIEGDPARRKAGGERAAALAGGAAKSLAEAVSFLL